MPFIAKAQHLITIAFGAQDLEVVSFKEDMHPVKGFSLVTLRDRSGRSFSVAAFPSGEICLRDLSGDEDEEVET